MLKCQICGFEQEKTILSHVRQIHKISAEEYRVTYNNAPLRESWMKDNPEAMKTFYTHGTKALAKSKSIKPSFSLNGRWAMKYDACITCGTTEIKHAGEGMCIECRKTYMNAKINAENKEKVRIKNQQLANDGIENIDYIICQICNKPFERLYSNGHLKDHNISVGEYKTLFPDAHISSKNVTNRVSENVSKGRIALMNERGYLNDETMRQKKSAELVKKNMEGGFDKVSKLEQRFANYILSRGYHLSIGELNLDKSPKIFWQYNVNNMMNVDFADPERQIAIEVMGDYWHGWKFISGQCSYEELDHNQKNGIRADKSRATRLANKGWKIIKLWEHDLDENIYLQEFLEAFPIMGEPVVDYSAEEILHQFRESLKKEEII